ncbi:hypothetical protein [Kitasatospora viridis]|uniref:Uncharacterized protein n=1 Tax=Kitasatospora viridis TaxID=281105 RepID=A0A561UBH0_9ACTN|nr:hypothetical protein [Kitasatospora viridis]TWF96705.1 hypothetical protein FHX73_11477 [Kitasatospora viridis]
MTVLPVQNADVPPQDRSADSVPDPAPGLGENLLRYAELGGFELAADTHAWYAAADTVTGAEEARAASTALAEVRGGDLNALREAADRLSAEAALREPTTVAEVVTLVGLLRRIRETAGTLRSGAYEADLDALAAATANGSWRKERGLKISWGRRRKLRAEARRLAVADRPRRDALHAALVAAAAEREEWQALAPATGTVARPVDAELLELTGQCADSLIGGLRELGRLLAGRELIALGFDELAELVEALAADEGTLYRLPELRTLRAGLDEGGIEELLAELTAARADRAAAQELWAAHTGTAEVDDLSEAETADAELEAEEVAEPAPVLATELAVDVDLIVIPSPSPEPSVEVIAPAEPEAVAEADVEPEPEVVEEPLVEEPVAEVAEPVEEPVAVEEEPAAPVAEAPVVEDAPETEPETEPEAEVAVVEEPTAELVEEEPVAEAPVVEETPEPTVEEPLIEEPAAVEEPLADETAAVDEQPAADEPAAEKPAPAQRRVRRPKRPELTAGKPITAYSADELLALVRWIDSDFTTRTDDELLRAAMKELGFARLGPRIKEALATAVSAARAEKN